MNLTTFKHELYNEIFHRMKYHPNIYKISDDIEINSVNNFIIVYYNALINMNKSCDFKYDNWEIIRYAIESSSQDLVKLINKLNISASVLSDGWKEVIKEILKDQKIIELIIYPRIQEELRRGLSRRNVGVVPEMRIKITEEKALEKFKEFLESIAFRRALKKKVVE